MARERPGPPPDDEGQAAAMMGRRGLLRAGAVMAPLGAAMVPLGAAVSLLGSAPAAAARRRLRLGIAEITLRRELSQDYAGTLRKAAALGYSHFAFAMSAGGASANQPSSRDKAKMARDAGLEVGVARFGVVPQTYERDIADAAAIGARIIALSAGAPFFTGRALGVATREAFDAWLPQLAALAGRCRAAGLTFAYHNHWWDFAPFADGQTPLDIIARTVSSADLSFEVDLAWAWYGGVAPLDLLARLGPRVVSMHLKDVDRSRAPSATGNNDRNAQAAAAGRQMVVIGQGEMGYASLLPRLSGLTRATGYIEVDAPADGLAAAAAGLQFFREHS